MTPHPVRHCVPALAAFLAFSTILPVVRGAEDETALSVSAEAFGKTLAERLSADGTGEAVLVARQGKILFSQGYGQADREGSVAATPETRFRIGSMTKQFTAAAILKLASEGKLSLADPLTKYLPGYPGGEKITLRHLLNHTSGLHNYTDKPDFASKVATAIAPDDLIAWFRNDPPDFPPGEQFRYCNTGYFLLGQIVAQVSGHPLGDYFQEQFFTPLSMRDTGTWKNATTPEHGAKGYSFDGKEFHPAAEWDMSWAGGAGDLYSTTADIWRWTEALHHGRVLPAASLQAALEEFTVKKPETLSLRYGMGLYHAEIEWLPAIGHTGGLPGYLSEVMWLPDEDTTVVVLSNAMPPKPGSSPAEIVPLAVRAFLGSEIAGHAPKELSAPDTKAYAAYAGRYQYPEGVQTITVEGGRIYGQLDGQPRYEIFPSGPGEFFYKVAAARIVFHRGGKDGAVTSLSHTQNAATFSAAKLGPAPAEVKLSDEALDAFTGRYQYSPAAVLTVTRREHQLYAQLTGQPEFPIYAKSDHEFFWKIVPATVEFVKGDDGKVAKAVHHQGGATLDAPRVP